MGNEGLVKQIYFLPNRIFYEYLTQWHFSQSTREMTSWHDSSTSSHVFHRWPFHRLLSRMLVTNCTDSSLTLDSSLISHTHPLQINPYKYREMIEEITIKFGTELKPTKASWKSQLYNLPLWLFHDKTLKQTLGLNVSLGTKAKLIHI